MIHCCFRQVWNLRLGIGIACLLVASLLAASPVTPSVDESTPDPTSEPPAEILVVIGASGTEEYAAKFAEWAADWEKVSQSSGATLTMVDGREGADSKDQMRAWLSARSEAVDAAPTVNAPETSVSSGTRTRTPIWIVMIGHGTYAREIAKFNLRGPDVSAAEMSDWLAPIARPVVVVNCASASCAVYQSAIGKRTRHRHVDEERQ